MKIYRLNQICQITALGQYFFEPFRRQGEVAANAWQRTAAAGVLHTHLSAKPNGAGN